MTKSKDRRVQTPKPNRHVSGRGKYRERAEFRAPKYDRSKDGRWSQ